MLRFCICVGCRHASSTTAVKCINIRKAYATLPIETPTLAPISARCADECTKFSSVLASYPNGLARTHSTATCTLIECISTKKNIISSTAPQSTGMDYVQQQSFGEMLMLGQQQHHHLHHQLVPSRFASAYDGNALFNGFYNSKVAILSNAPPEQRQFVHDEAHVSCVVAGSGVETARAGNELTCKWREYCHLILYYMNVLLAIQNYCLHCGTFPTENKKPCLLLYFFPR